MTKNNFLKQLTLLAVCLLLGLTSRAQVKVGDNPTTINANSVLEMESTTKGMLLPRLTLSSTTSFAPLAAHVAGMTVYNTATAGDVTPGFFYNDGSKWVRIASPVAALNTTQGPLITVSNGTGATFTSMSVAVDTTALKAFMSSAIQNGAITGKNTSAGSLITVTNGAGASFTAMTVAVDTAALKTFLNGKIQSSVSAPLTGDGTVGNPLTITRATATNGVLTTVTNGTNAAFTALKYDVDTNALKTFISNNATSGSLTGSNLSAGTLLQTTGTPTGASLKAAGYQVDTTALKTFISNTATSGSLTGQNTTAGQLITVTNGTGAALKNNSVAVDTAALKTFISNTATAGSLTGQNLTAGTLLQTTGTPTGASLKAAGYQVDTTALKTFVSGRTGVSATAPITGDGTTANPLGVTRATATSGVLTTVSNGTNAAFTALQYNVDTTALKAFVSGKTAVAASAPITGNGTTASPLSVTQNSLSAGQLVTVTGGTNATFTAASVAVDTTALKTFVSGRTAVSASAPITGDGTTANPISVTRATATSGVLTTVSNGTNAAFTALQYNVDTTALKAFVSGKTAVAASAPITGNGTTASPLSVTQNSLSAGQLVTVTGGTNATFTAASVAVDTTALKTFVSGRTAVSASAPITGDGTTANPISVTRATATSGVLTTVTNGTNAAFTALKYDVDTNALKTMLTNAGYDNSTDRFVENAGNTVVSAGNVGIGNTAPSAKLEVTGNTKVTTKPTALVTDSVVMRFTDGELRQMSIARLLGQLDTDGDGIVDADDPDIDGDGVLNAVDSCKIQFGCTPTGCPRSCAPTPSTNGSAIVTSFGAPACAANTINGTMLAGVPVSGVTMSLYAFVTKLGSYNITAGPTNGVTFMGSGNFTVLGCQLVTLTATGTPTAVDTHSFTTNTSPAATVSAPTAALSASTGGSAVVSAWTSTVGCALGAGTNNSPAGVRQGGVNQTMIQGVSTTDTITLVATVTTAGTYNISTNAINGKTFTASGTFGATGSQTVFLVSTGAASAAGNHIWALNTTPSINAYGSTLTTNAPLGNTYTAHFNGCDSNGNLLHSIAQPFTAASYTGGAVFSNNTTCANKPISAQGCGGVTSVTASSGRVHSTININGQCWLQTNLIDAPSIYSTYTTGSWTNTSPGDQGYWGYYNTTTTNGTAGWQATEPATNEGIMYQWCGAMNATISERSRGICPSGWHLPSDCEWMYLEHGQGMSLSEQQIINTWRSNTADNEGTPGYKLRSQGTGQTNASGFSGLLAGYRNTDGTFPGRTTNADWWSS